MKKNILIVRFSVWILIALNSTISFADSRTNSNCYQLVYDSASSIDTVPLNSATITIKVFLDGTPAGVQIVNTDRSGHFCLSKNYNVPFVIRMISVHDETKYGARCCGLSSSDGSKIVVNCNKEMKIINSSCDH